MNIDDRLKIVKLNEIECERHADRARAAWTHVKLHAREAATPWRIVTVGAIGGFLVGRSSTVDAAGSSVGGKLFASVAQMLVTSLGAAGAAGAAAASAADAAAVATSDAVAAGSTTPETRVAAAKAMNAETDAAESVLEQDS